MSFWSNFRRFLLFSWLFDRFGGSKQDSPFTYDSSRYRSTVNRPDYLRDGSDAAPRSSGLPEEELLEAGIIDESEVEDDLTDELLELGLDKDDPVNYDSDDPADYDSSALYDPDDYDADDLEDYDPNDGYLGVGGPDFDPLLDDYDPLDSDFGFDSSSDFDDSDW